MRLDVFQERPSSRVRSGRSRRRDVPSTRPAGRRRLLAVEQLEGRTLLTDVTPFTPRFSTDTNGDIAIVANTLMTVSSNNPDAANIQAGVNNPSGVDNNNLDMVYVNDGSNPTTTFDSSSAQLNLPQGATVLFAGLYWGGDLDTGSSSELENARTQVKFETPSSGGYSNITGTLIGENTAGSSNPGGYHAFADVTGMVSAAGNGTYTVANVQATEGVTSSGRYAGWSLVVAYNDPNSPPRNLTVFDGYSEVDVKLPPTATTIPISGFETPPVGSGPVNAQVGIVAYEGDLGITGDTASLDNHTLSDATHPANNFFDSTISNLGVNVTSKTPNYINQLGYDSSIIQANGIIPNGATSADIELTTSGDSYFPGVVTTAIDLYAPNIKSTKSVVDMSGGSVVRPGDILDYTINVSNTGGNSAKDVILSDPIPNFTQFVPGSLQVTAGANTGTKTDAAGDDQAEYDAAGNQVIFRLGAGANARSGGVLPIGGSSTVSFEVQVDPGTPGQTVVTNQATIDYTGVATGIPLSTLSNPADVTVVVPSADLALSKTVNTTAPNVGDTITYTVTLNNIGPDPATDVQVSDPLPIGLQFVSATPTEGTYDSTTGTWTVGGVAVGAPQTLTITATVISPAAETNSAAVTHSDQFDPDPANNSASATVTPQQADLAVFKSVSNPTPNVGVTITYTITLDNGGPDPASGVVVSDILPAGVTYVSSSASEGNYDPRTNLWTVGDVNVATPQTLVITVTVVSAAPTTNTATIAKADQFDPDLGNNSATTSIVPNQADLGLVKSVDDPRPNVGDTVTFTVLLVNSGPAAATGVVVSDPLPAGLQFVSATPSEGTYDSTTGTWTVGGVAVGAPQTLTIKATVISPAGVTNTATITGADQPDPDTSNNSDSTSIDPQQADLALFKAVSDAHPKAGETVIFIVGLRNKGPNDATGVQVSDPLPSGLQFVSAKPSEGTYDSTTGLWSVGTVSTNAAQGLIITATVISPAAETNSAAVTHSDQFDPNPANNSASATVTPQQADLMLAKEVSDPSPNVGDVVTFTVTLSNAGPNTATGVTVSDPLPAGLQLVSANPSEGTYDPATGLWSIGTLATSQPATLTILAIVVSPAAETNTAAITHSDQFDLNTTNNTATSTVTPQPPGPTVTNLQRFGFHAQPTQLVLTFDSPLDPVRAQDVNNYQLFERLHGGRLPRSIPIKSATYDSTLHTVTLTFERPPFLALHRQYGLIVRGTPPSGVAGSTGVPLVGRGIGVHGSNYFFQIFGDEILAGPNRHTDPHGRAGVHRVQLHHGSRAVHVR